MILDRPARIVLFQGMATRFHKINSPSVST
jgi:hypothetical protein